MAGQLFSHCILDLHKFQAIEEGAGLGIDSPDYGQGNRNREPIPIFRDSQGKIFQLITRLQRKGLIAHQRTWVGLVQKIAGTLSFELSVRIIFSGRIAWISLKRVFVVFLAERTPQGFPRVLQYSNSRGYRHPGSFKLLSSTGLFPGVSSFLPFLQLDLPVFSLSFSNLESFFGFPPIQIAMNPRS